MKKLIVLADWADDSLTCQEVKSAVEGFLKDPSYVNISFVASSPSTIHTSYILSQLIQTEEKYGRPLETVIFQNTDPRLDIKKTGDKVPGALPLVIRLKSGLFLTGPNSGYDFSLIRGKIDATFEYTDLEKGSQFRSRDLYSRVSAHLMDAMEDDMGLEEVSKDVIPALLGNFIGHIDNYGNIKTTITLSDLKGKYEFGDYTNITINNKTKKAKFVKNLFGGEPGELVIYPGSSGDLLNPFIEISIWRFFTEKNPSTGKEEFNNPKPGAEVVLK